MSRRSLFVPETKRNAEGKERKSVLFRAWANEILDREAEREASLGEAKKCGRETRKAKKVDAGSARTPLTQRGETHRFLTAKLDAKPLAEGTK